MMDYAKMLENVTKEGDVESTSDLHFHSKVIMIDALNLFFRNFATINFINKEGVPVGGLGGFIRSLGSLVSLIKPTGVYVIFDGVGSSTNRKNLMPEYKGNRGGNRITNWDIYDNLDDENDSKVDQISRIIHYLQCLPVKVAMIDKAEADDMIAYMAKKLPARYDSQVIIVSSDKDYLQLVNDNVKVYRPIERKFFGEKEVHEDFQILTSNFIIMKALLGDNSDNLKGIKGLGLKTIIKLFPELQTETVTLQKIFQLSEERLGQKKAFAQILYDKQQIEKNFKVMNLHDPILDDRQIEYIEEIINTPQSGFYKDTFLDLYEEDGLDHFIRNIQFWVSETFHDLSKY